MSLHRQPHEEQEEIFTSILSSFSSLAATSPSFSSCFPEHSEINSALLLLKVRRGTWLKKDVLSRWPTYILASDGFLSRSTVNELWKCFHSAITLPPCQTVSLGRLRGISVQNHRLLWTLFFESFNLVNYWSTEKTEKYQFFHSSNSGFSVFSFSQSFGKLLALFSSAFRFDRLWG